MQLKLLFILSSIVKFCTGGITSGSPKIETPRTGVTYEQPSTSRLGLSSLQNVKDRQTTHWESSAHLNFVDDDTNDDPALGLYASVLREPSALRLSEKLQAVPIGLRATRPDRDVSGSMMLTSDQQSRCERCLRDVIPAGARGTWLSELRNDMQNVNKNLSGRKFVLPINRGVDEGWAIQEPFFVDEPGWISIEINARNARDHEDPFYVARGKRLRFGPVEESSNVQTSKNFRDYNVDGKLSFYSENPPKYARATRQKSDEMNESLLKSLLSNKPELTSGLSRMDRGYVQPRDKHSDILDILNEPFFISRGKKKFANIDESTEFFADNKSAGFPTKRQNPLRDRRGLMEDLLKPDDPFYLARGKKSLETRREFKDTVAFSISTEIASENSTVVAKH